MVSVNLGPDDVKARCDVAVQEREVLVPDEFA